ncbi:hypothetical protein MPL3365_100223 [Mesorhizobium plurifarium]|uniref:Uncharacterized protein n=1 Tax=Mesorhizobium plurifarium TaxID=69974 RepID=A0A090GSF4_MESPL|nr:hypothetical protein MPL3365_100223 [Mesorhizobium plurifarium]
MWPCQCLAMAGSGVMTAIDPANTAAPVRVRKNFFMGIRTPLFQSLHQMQGVCVLRRRIRPDAAGVQLSATPSTACNAGMISGWHRCRQPQA